MPDPSASPYDVVRKSVPTFTFVGVSTGGSSSLRAFPGWVAALGRPEVVIEGVDLELHDDPERYRQVVTQIKYDPLSLGGLVTTHKIDLLDAARDMFDELGPYATVLDEVSAIAKRGGRLVGYATDPEAGGLSLQAILGPGYFGRTGGEVLCFGAGGAAAALSLYLINRADPADRPRRFVLVDIVQDRLDRLRELINRLRTTIAFDFIRHTSPAQNDALMAAMPEAGVVVNATGMGKDRPGSPVTDTGRFPRDGIAWELNYRGERRFMQQAEAQAAGRNVRVEDGWVYFVHGWTQVISKVLDVPIDPPTLRRLFDVAEGIR